MSAYRVFAGAVIQGSVWVLSAIGRADAQTCSISSTARGPLSCAVMTAVTTTIRMPTLVSVNVTPLRTSETSPGSGQHASIVEAAVGVSANRSYSLQIGRAPDSSRSHPSAQPAGTSSSIGGRALELNEAPSPLGSFEHTMGDHTSFLVALHRQAATPLDMPAAAPIRLIVTIAAP